VDTSVRDQLLHPICKSNMVPIPIIQSLHQQIALCEAQLQDLRRQLSEAEHDHQQQQQQEQERKHQDAHGGHDPLAYDFTYGIHDDFRSEVYAALSQTQNNQPTSNRWPLEKNDYRRYGRQLIMPEIGLQGTLIALTVVLTRSSSFQIVSG
jgi:adenylyltransferase/sulfurtransferase